MRLEARLSYALIGLVQATGYAGGLDCLDAAVGAVIQIFNMFLFEAVRGLKSLRMKPLTFDQPKEVFHKPFSEFRCMRLLWYPFCINLHAQYSHHGHGQSLTA